MYVKENDTEIISLFSINDLKHFPDLTKQLSKINFNYSFLFFFYLSFCLTTRLIEMILFFFFLYFFLFLSLTCKNCISWHWEWLKRKVPGINLWRIPRGEGDTERQKGIKFKSSFPKQKEVVSAELLMKIVSEGLDQFIKNLAIST